MGEENEKKYKKKFDMPFVKIRESEDEELVEVGPIRVHKKGERENVTFFGFGDSKGLNRKLTLLAWALFFIMWGTLMVYENMFYEVPGAFKIGVGLILLGLNFTRYLKGIKVKKFTTGLGLVVIALGIGEIFGFEVPFLALILIVVGLFLVVEGLLK